MTHHDVSAAWQRITAWLKSNASPILGTLQDGADEEEILRTEEFLGIKLPEDIKASYRIHNGQLPESHHFLPGEFLPLADMCIVWGHWKELYDEGTFDSWTRNPLGPARNDWWNPRWLPLTDDMTGDHYALDLDPPESGNVGQIVLVLNHDPDLPVVAESFAAWLEALAADLEAGKYEFSQEEGSLLRTDPPA